RPASRPQHHRRDDHDVARLDAVDRAPDRDLDPTRERERTAPLADDVQPEWRLYASGRVGQAHQRERVHRIEEPEQGRYRAVGQRDETYVTGRLPGRNRR